MDVSLQLPLGLESEMRPYTPDARISSSTFTDNLQLPIHRWFRFSAGFSAEWVQHLISEQRRRGRLRVLDPFAGSGTVLLESELSQTPAIGLEAHPFLVRIARAKLRWPESAVLFLQSARSMLEKAQAPGCADAAYARPPLLTKCFPSPVLSRLEALRSAWEQTMASDAVRELTWLALTSILRQCSPVGTAQWQYVLPAKTKVKALDPYKAFHAKAILMADDICLRQSLAGRPSAMLYDDDARTCSEVPSGWADLILTSPPYANNYDYADATRLEMTFWGEIRGWGDLQSSVRTHLVRSCTQHVACLNGEAKNMIGEPLLAPIRNELSERFELLSAERERHRGKKAYNTMIVAYFHDMARVWQALRRVAAPGALACFVVGDSAPYGVHVPVEEWLGRLAVASGFKSYTFEKIRDRNIKWKNRKHRVPLNEGRLWVHA